MCFKSLNIWCVEFVPITAFVNLQKKKFVIRQNMVGPVMYLKGDTGPYLYVFIET